MLSSRTKEGLVNFAGFGIGLLIFLVGVVVSKFHFKVLNAELIGIASLFVALLADRGASYYSRQEEIETQRRLSDSLKASAVVARDGPHSFLQDMGTANEAAPSILRRIEDAKIVKNTFVQFGPPDRIDKSEYKKIIDCYETLLKKQDGHWYDIISVNELFSKRYTDIFSRIGKRTRIKGTHRIGVLRHNVPLMNFILISDHSSKFTEVYFGEWSSHPGTSIGRVFRSRNSNLIKTFEDYFNLLWTQKLIDSEITVNYEQPAAKRFSGNNIVDRKGLWLTASFRIVPSNVAGEKINVLDSIGLIEITYQETKLRLTGEIFNSDGRTNPTSAANVMQSTNRIFFTYEHHNDRRTSGFCTYKFVAHGDSNYIVGFFVNEQDRERVELIGVKVPNVEELSALQKRLGDEALGESLKKLSQYALQVGRPWTSSGDIARYLPSAAAVDAERP